MASPRDIRKRIKAVGNIARITDTMEKIARSKFAKAQHRATATKPFTEGVFELVRDLSARAGNLQHPLIQGPAGGIRGKAAVLIIASDRGLCGPYNGSVLRAGAKHVREIGEGDRELHVSGRKAVGFLKFNKIRVDETHSEFGDTPRYEDVEHLAQTMMDRFSAGELRSVSVVYMRFLSMGRQRPEVLQLLPLRPPTSDDGAASGAGGAQTVYEFSPEPEELLDDLLPLAVKTTLFQCFNDAVVSEHIARMVAMKAATDNANKMGKSLTRVYNRLRQAQITTELSEIIGGAAALE